MGKFCTKGLYASGMVLQRNTTNCIFGTADAGSTVTMDFRGEKYSAQADSNGNWKIEYNPGKEGGPFELSLLSSSENEKIVFTDVYVGEVWVSSGQSNAQLPMQRMYFSYKEEFALPANNNIRIITVPISYSFDGEKDSVENPVWLNASPENMGLLSGTSYFFAKKLSKELKMPVGIINASQGGSPIAAWMNEEALSDVKNQYCLDQLKKCRNPEYIQSTKADIKAKQDKWFDAIARADKGFAEGWDKLAFDQISSSAEWKDCTIPNDFALSGKAAIVWFKKEIELSEELVNQFNSKKTWLWFGTIQDADAIFVNGTQIGATYYTYPPRRYVVPANTLKAGKNTVTVRCQKNGTGDLRFYSEKKYCLFTEDVYVHPVATRNVELPKADENADCSKGVKIDLSGVWKMNVACETECHPGEIFFEWEPTALFNSMLAPSFNYAIAGALWYQGESDSEIADTYKNHLVKMIELWREKFVYAPKNMPFVVMQLPNWADGRKLDNVYSDWSLMREAQREAANSVENAAYSVTVDAGEWNDLHPEKKRTAGTRAAVQALRIGYSKDFEAPVEMVKADKTNDGFVVRFGGDRPLKAFNIANNCADFCTESRKVYGFEVLTSKNELLKADAELISGNEVKVLTPDTKDQLIELRFLWANSPEVVNLYSDSLIPVSTFRIKL